MYSPSSYICIFYIYFQGSEKLEINVSSHFGSFCFIHLKPTEASLKNGGR